MRCAPPCAVALALVAGCYQQHSGDATDAGLGARADAPAVGTDDGAVRDADAAGVDDGTGRCTTSIGLTRCDGECSCPSADCCPWGTLCYSEVGLCLDGWAYSPCGLTREPSRTRPDHPPGCPAGACFYLGSETPPGDARGICVPIEVCLMSDAELGAHRCFWSDGTDVTRLPPLDPCPSDSDVVACGPTCSSEPCIGEGGCGGLSDTRGFGVCLDTMRMTCSGNPSDALDRELCTIFFRSAECSCMRPIVPAPSTITPFGFLLLRDACERYIAHFPGELECLDV